MDFEARSFRSSVLSWAGRSSMFGGAALAALTVCLGVFPSVSAAQSTKPATEQGVPARKVTPLQAGQETFPTAAAAVQALETAVQSNDQAALLKVLGPNAKDILSSGDATEDQTDRDEFVNRYQQMHRMVMEPDGTTTIYIGAENYPMPIPLVRAPGNAWYFDTTAGKQEILFRRVGENELAVIEVCHELADAEKEYYAKPHDGDSVRQYAQKFISDPGKHDGLYWEAASGEPDSPIGPLVAVAASEGYSKDTSRQSQAFHGYYFRILKGQGTAPGGAERHYIVNGKMTNGFAIIAYPAEYRSSGVMTFIVNDDGIVYEKVLGHRTGEVAMAMKDYDRDAAWHKAD